MTTVEVGPVTIRGGHPVDEETAREAIESLGDELMLVDGEPVPAADVWRDLLREAAGRRHGRLVLVHPSGWSRRHVDVVAEAARQVRANTVVLTRSEALGSAGGSVVELGSDHIVVASAGMFAVSRSAPAAVDSVVSYVDGRDPVVVDAPAGVTDGVALASTIVAALRARGLEAALAGQHAVRAGVPAGRPAAGVRNRPRRTAVLTGVVCAAATVGARLVGAPGPAPAEPTALLVEGRVGVAVPADWNVARITGGSGSARLQIVSPANAAVALHVTQSPLPRRQSLDEVAATLRAALDAESAEVFTDFRPEIERAGRAAVGYRERRPGHEIDWTVFDDGLLRIGVGCQSPSGSAELVRSVCDAAVRSAHAVV